METFPQVIDAFGGAPGFAAAIGIPESHARTMKARASIPADRWSRVIEAATERNLDGITFELLARIAAHRREPTEATQ